LRHFEFGHDQRLAAVHHENVKPPPGGWLLVVNIDKAFLNQAGVPAHKIFQFLLRDISFAVLLHISHLVQQHHSLRLSRILIWLRLSWIPMDSSQRGEAVQAVFTAEARRASQVEGRRRFIQNPDAPLQRRVLLRVERGLQGGHNAVRAQHTPGLTAANGGGGQTAEV